MFLSSGKLPGGGRTGSGARRNERTVTPDLLVVTLSNQDFTVSIKIDIQGFHLAEAPLSTLRDNFAACGVCWRIPEEYTRRFYGAGKDPSPERVCRKVLV